MTAAKELRDELLRGLAYYQWWESEALHEEETAKQRWIECEIEGNGYAILWYNSQLLELGRQTVAQHAHGWLELHVLPKLNAAIPAADTLKAQAERGELMMPEIELELSKLEAERDQWRNAHASVVAQKRNLSAKYGAIMARKPAARWRRAKKKFKRCVTNVTHKFRIRW